jgi:hypothetical protein
MKRAGPRWRALPPKAAAHFKRKLLSTEPKRPEEVAYLEMMRLKMKPHIERKLESNAPKRTKPIPKDSKLHVEEDDEEEEDEEEEEEDDEEEEEDEDIVPLEQAYYTRGRPLHPLDSRVFDDIVPTQETEEYIARVRELSTSLFRVRFNERHLDLLPLYILSNWPGLVSIFPCRVEYHFATPRTFKFKKFDSEDEFEEIPDDVIDLFRQQQKRYTVIQVVEDEGMNETGDGRRLHSQAILVDNIEQLVYFIDPMNYGAGSTDRFLPGTVQYDIDYDHVNRVNEMFSRLLREHFHTRDLFDGYVQYSLVRAGAEQNYFLQHSQQRADDQAAKEMTKLFGFESADTPANDMRSGRTFCIVMSYYIILAIIHYWPKVKEYTSQSARNRKGICMHRFLMRFSCHSRHDFDTAKMDDEYIAFLSGVDSNTHSDAGDPRTRGKVLVQHDELTNMGGKRHLAAMIHDEHSKPQAYRPPNEYLQALTQDFDKNCLTSPNAWKMFTDFGRHVIVDFHRTIERVRDFETDFTTNIRINQICVFLTAAYPPIIEGVGELPYHLTPKAFMPDGWLHRQNRRLIMQKLRLGLEDRDRCLAAGIAPQVVELAYDLMNELDGLMEEWIQEEKERLQRALVDMIYST